MTTLATNPLPDDQPRRRIPRVSHADWPLRWLLLALLGAVVVYGCKNLDPHSRPQDDTAYAERSIGKIVGRADTIEDNADIIQTRTPRASLLRIIENVQAIKFNAGAIREDVADGLHALGEANKKIEGLQASNATLTKERDQAREQRDSSLRKAVGGAVGIGVIALALSAAIFFGGYTRWAKMGAAFGATLTLAGVVIGWYSLWLMLAVVIPLGIGLSIFVIHRLRNESWSTYRNAGIIEGLKEELNEVSPERRLTFFGKGAKPGKIDQIDAKLGVPQGAKELTDDVRKTLPSLATPLAVATPVVVTNVATKTATTATRKRKTK